MFLSVVIPAYNEERYLPVCLRALREQTYPADCYEVIVVDNASTDATADTAWRLGARVVHEPVKGIARARQAGFEAAQGRIIASTDADTVVPACWLAHIAGHFIRDPDLAGVCGPVYWLDGRPHERLIMKYPVTWALAVSNRVGWSWWVGSNFAVRAQVFRLVGGFRGFDSGGLLGDDLYLAEQVRRVARVLFDPDLAVHASARRVQEGYFNYLRRTAINAARVAVLHQPAVPPPDIR
jgi:glycosyltransferase involved in cell wall biosynthesis